MWRNATCRGLAASPFGLPRVLPDADPVWHLWLVIRCRQRDRVQAFLGERGVGTLVRYPVPPHLQPAYAELGLARGAFPITEEPIHDEVLSLPMGPHMKLEAVDEVAAVVRAALG